MPMQAATNRVYNTLFTTVAGTEVKQPVETLVPDHILIHHPRTGCTTLDGVPISRTSYQYLLEYLFDCHPNSLVIDNVYNQVFIYPKNINE
jgi:hypothetical protein